MSVKIAFYITSSLLFLSHSSFGQTWQGTVLDKATSLPIPYATIGVRSKNMGVIADRLGKFQIDLSGASSADSVVVSSIGYESQKLLVRSLTLNTVTEIWLEPIAMVLEEVVIVPTKNLVTIGNKDFGNGFTGWGDYTSSRGRTRGLRIEHSGFPIRVTQFAMRVQDNEFDSVKLRLHLQRSAPNAQIKEELLRGNVLFTAIKDQHWVYVDLSDHNIVISEPVWVGVEWVDAWTSSTAKNSLLLTLSMGKKEGYAYSRNAPAGSYTVSLEKKSPSMYLIGYRVK